MILKCPKCGGQHIEYDVSIAEKRHCACGHTWTVEDDRAQIEPLVIDPRWHEPTAQADG